MNLSLIPHTTAGASGASQGDRDDVTTGRSTYICSPVISIYVRNILNYSVVDMMMYVINLTRIHMIYTCVFTPITLCCAEYQYAYTSTLYYTNTLLYTIHIHILQVQFETLEDGVTVSESSLREVFEPFGCLTGKLKEWK